MSNYQLICYLSMVVNFGFLVLSLIWLRRRGVFAYFRNRNTPTYFDLRTAQFAHLPSWNTHPGIIFLGDSITEMGEWSELFGKTDLKNRGIAGDTTTGILKRLPAIAELKPSKIFMMIGINDLYVERRTSAAIINNYRQILEYLSEQTPETKVYIQSILPVENKHFLPQIQVINQHLSKLARDFNYEYLELYSHFINQQNELDSQYSDDGIHVNGKGYLLWKKLISESVS